MHRILLFLCACLSFPAAYHAGKFGLVELDSHSFDKILNKFDAALVKFDVAYPYGDKHEAFQALALEAKDLDELLVADVNVKDYAEKENEALAAKYGANKETFPVVKLFVKGRPEPYAFDETYGFTIETLRKFVREKTGLYLSLPGCVRQLDALAVKFMKADDKNARDSVLKDVEEYQKTMKEKHAESGKVYKAIMTKVLEKGDDFVKNEVNRVKKLLNEKVSEEKKKGLNIRLNILETFKTELTKKQKEDL